MKWRVLFVWALAVASVMTSNSAMSQDNSRQFCASIAKYFIDPPSGFIKERGQQTEDGVWTSNLNFPNADCSIYFNRGRHRAACTYNSNSTPQTALAWYRDVETRVDQCVAALPQPVRSKYIKNTETETMDNGTKVVETSWENDDDDALYSISIRGFIRKNGTAFNSMSVVYKKK
jgi:hypothetical protein